MERQMALFLSNCITLPATVFMLLQFILHDFHGAQLFSARGAILLSTELAPSLEDAPRCFRDIKSHQSPVDVNNNCWELIVYHISKYLLFLVISFCKKRKRKFGCKKQAQVNLWR